MDRQGHQPNGGIRYSQQSSLIETTICHLSADSNGIVGDLRSQVICCKIPGKPKTKEEAALRSKAHTQVLWPPTAILATDLEVAC